MLGADFRAETNKIRSRYHMPSLTDGLLRRKPIRGLTEERPIKGPELRGKPSVTIRNYAIGFYNAAAATAIGKIWKNSVPDISSVELSEGAIGLKILFNNAQETDFSDPASDPMKGAPEIQILNDGGPKAVRLLQMDVAVVDKRAPTGWVFGTVAGLQTIRWLGIVCVWSECPGGIMKIHSCR
jgi:hypothetical protein